MRIMKCIAISMIFVLHTAVSAQNSAVSSESYWVGEFKVNEMNQMFKIRFERNGSTVKAVYHKLPYGSRTDLTTFKSDGDTFWFALPLQSDSIYFESVVSTADSISGEVKRGDKRGDFRMIQVVKLDPQILLKYSGSYECQDGTLIRINKDGGYYGSEPTFLEYTSLRFGTLFPTSIETFVSGSAFSSSFFPIDIQISFVMDKQGKVAGLNYSRGGIRIFAKRLDFKEEDVSYYTNDIKISGTLTLPLTKSPYPVIYIVNSSGPETREFGFWRTFFAANGFAVFACDKRGVGSSSGDWRKANFTDAATDVLNGIDLLKERSDIDKKKIGIWTISQGGWVAPLVANKSKDIAFMILHSGSMTTPAEQGTQATKSQLRISHVPDKEIGEALEFLRIDQNFTRTGNDWEKLQRLYKEGVSKNVDWVWEPASKDSWVRNWYRQIMDFDPVPSWQKVTIPVLAFFGELDITVKPDPSREILKNALLKAKNSDFSIRVVPKGSHGYLEVSTGLVSNDLPYVRKFCEGYFSEMEKWLTKRVK